MKVALSTAVSPDLARDALETFDGACRNRGLDGIELVLGPDDDPESLATPGLRVVALRTERIDARSAARLARASARLAAPVSLPASAAPPDTLDALARTFADERGSLLLAHGTDLAEVLALVPLVASRPSLGLAWEIRPSSEDLGDRGAILLAARDHIRLVRLFGGGPEQGDQSGRGLGSLFHELALSGYASPIVLHPSRPDALPRWRAWLSSNKSAGCGHAYDTRDLDVDVRDVEPKDRLDTILGAYRALARGATLKLTVDHDPSCMYYMLQATEPAGTFSFRKTDDGPEVWRAEVVKN